MNAASANRFSGGDAMAQGNRLSEGRLLYDPLFENAPDTVIRDTPGKGFFGKAIVKKAIFVLLLMVFVGASVVMSFNSLAKEKYDFELTDGGYMLSEFVPEESDTVLDISCVFADTGAADRSKPVTSVREYALCCNEYTQFIFIGKDVAQIENTSFYYCTALKAVIVDKENPCFESRDGVLYRKENGSLTEIMLYPMQNSIYRTALSLGMKAPDTAAQAQALIEEIASLELECREYLEAFKSNDGSAEAMSGKGLEQFKKVGTRYEIAPGVTRIGELCFSQCEDLRSVVLPDSVKEIGSMAFFKCKYLEGFSIPHGAVSIGSDAFSYCERVEYIFVPETVRSIGHHAFFECKGADRVYMECAEDNMPRVGEDWLPKYRKGILRDVPVENNAIRRNG